jgi:RHS repeat-associated protein
MEVGITLRNLKSFGDVAAEHDAVLDYSLTTEAVERLRIGTAFVVLGRKGSGKTALVRHFAEGQTGQLSKALNLRRYPWSLHASRVDSGASSIEAFVSSWRYLIAIEVAALVLEASERPMFQKYLDLAEFFRENYGGPSPQLSDILRPTRLRVSKASIQPSVLGVKLGGVDLERKGGDHRLGLELNALSTTLLKTAIEIAKNEELPTVSLHFDELDQGLSTFDEERQRMLIGLILAARELRRESAGAGYAVNPIIYLRTDLWDDLDFSDKNKITETTAVNLDWSSETLLRLVGARIQAKLDHDATWDNIASPSLMRGSQTKWNHIISRTFLRPRDVIKFLNAGLSKAKKRPDEPLVFENPDIVGAREEYSNYLKRELDDEILPHWPQWGEALQAFSAISTVTFDKADFEREYGNKRSSGNQIAAEEALAMLFRFSVVGYERRSGYGGSSWVFQYSDPQAGWDAAAVKFKVHPGLTYMQQRYYDPSIGRLLNVDPVLARERGDNFNRYWYANNNPYKFTDPDGRETGAKTG